MASTHDVRFDGPLVVKRYTSWGRGGHRREWSALQLLHQHARGLAPQPVAADLDARPPTVTMAVVPGLPLAGQPTPEQTDGLAEAIQMLWATPLDGSPPFDTWHDDLDAARRLTSAPRPARGVLADAYDAAGDWWHGPDPALLRTPPTTTVLGHRDPNLANYLWDGRRIRIVDFEDAAVSDPATELAVLIEHLSARCVDTDRLRAHVRVDELRLRAARRLWAMFWLWLVLPGGRSEARNPPGTADAQARRLLALLHDQ